MVKMDEDFTEVDLLKGGSAKFEILEIKTVPDITASDQSSESRRELINSKMEQLLTILHNQYCSFCKSDTGMEAALDMLWFAEPVVGQLYQAHIRIFLVLRIASYGKGLSSCWLKEWKKVCVSVLSQAGYLTESNCFQELFFLEKILVNGNVQFLSRNSKALQLNSRKASIVPVFDCFGEDRQQINELVNCLIEHPYYAVSFQLIMTQYTAKDKQTILYASRFLQMLSTRTISSTGLDQEEVREAAELYRYYNLNRDNAVFQFQILIMGKDSASMELMASLLNSMFETRKAHRVSLQTTVVEYREKWSAYEFSLFPWKVYRKKEKMQQNKKTGNRNRDHYMTGIQDIVTVKEASQFFSLPNYDEIVTAGLPKRYEEESVREFSEETWNGDIEIGEIIKGMKKRTLKLYLEDFTRHMFISGMPGTGKTTFAIGILDKLWKESRIPFLVIEPVKNEYRSMIAAIPELQVFTPGKSNLSVFSFNPFIPPENVRLESYKTVLKTVFQAAVTTSDPLDSILSMTVDNCYKKYGWADSDIMSNDKKTFNMREFIDCFIKTFEDIGYRGEAANIGKAGLVRLKGVQSLFDSNNAMSIRDLLERPTVIELAAVENKEQKALITVLVLLSMMVYVNANYPGDGILKNVLLLEEAHVLLSEEPIAAVRDTIPGTLVKESVKRLLAEIRSYGVGMIIADQFPRKIEPEIIAMTDCKVVFRQVEKASRQIMADCMNLGEMQMRSLVELKAGEAIFFYNKLMEPEKLVVEDYRKTHSIKVTVSDQELEERLVLIKKDSMQYPYEECKIFIDCINNCYRNRRAEAEELAQNVLSVMEENADLIIKKKREQGFPIGNDMLREKLILKQIPEIKRIMEMQTGLEDVEDHLHKCVIMQIIRKIRFNRNERCEDYGKEYRH